MYWRLLIAAFALVVVTGCRKAEPQPQLTLIEAAQSGNLDAVKQKIKEGADINVPQDKTGATPLMLAVGTGNIPLVEEILNSGAKVNDVNSRGYNAALIAVGNDDVEMLKLLKAKGADLNAKSKQGYSAYYIAKMYKFESMMTYLKSIGADTSDPKLNITRKAPTKG